MIMRELYLKRIREFYDSELVKVLLGIRRCGKSVLMQQIKNELIENGVHQSDVLYIDFESFKYRELRDNEKFYNYVINYFSGNQAKNKKYLFFDEIQEVNRFEEVINSFRVDLDCSIFITGSNSNLLGGELATLLSGRYVTFEISPFTYKEYCEFTNTTVSCEKNFADYLMFGGYPLVHSHNDSGAKSTILKDTLKSVVLKDVAERYSITDLRLLNNLVEYVLYATSMFHSTKNLANTLSSRGLTTTEKTISKYLTYIESSYLFSTCKKYNLQGKNILARSEKYYIADLGLRNASYNLDNIDFGACIETVVYNQLKALDYEIFVGKLYDKEVDFVVKKHQVTKYIQVAKVMTKTETLDREFAPLRKINDNYPKYVISMDAFDYSENGIIHLNLLDFLNDFNF